MVSEEKIPPVQENPTLTAAGFSRMKSEDGVGESLSDVSRHVTDALLYGRLYLQAQADRLKALFRNVVLIVVLGLIAAVVAVTILVTSAVLVCLGIADGIAALLGGTQWAGDLITAAIVLGTIIIVAVIAIRGVNSAARERTRLSYEKLT